MSVELARSLARLPKVSLLLLPPLPLTYKRRGETALGLKGGNEAARHVAGYSPRGGHLLGCELYIHVEFRRIQTRALE